MKTAYTICAGDEQSTVEVESCGDGLYRVTIAGETLELDARDIGPEQLHVLHRDEAYDVRVEGRVPALTVHLDGTAVPLRVLDERLLARELARRPGSGQSAEGAAAVRAPMPGKVVKCMVKVGEAVSPGQGIIVVEAMKMENELRAPGSGTVKAINVSEGQNVEAGEDLVLIE